MAEIDARGSDAGAVAERFRRAVTGSGQVGLVAVAHDLHMQGLTLYWTGDVPAEVVSFAEHAEVEVDIVTVPFTEAVIMAAVEHVVAAIGQSALEMHYVGPRMDWSGVRVGVDRRDMNLARMSLAETMKIAPAEIRQVPVTVEGTTAQFVAAPNPTT